jgi:hypothetical protein
MSSCSVDEEEQVEEGLALEVVPMIAILPEFSPNSVCDRYS